MMRGLWGTTALAAVLGMIGATPAAAQDAAGTQYAQAEPEITVTATRSEQDTFDVPGTVSVITDEEIQENLVTDIKDLIRFEPGVSVRTQPSRFSATLASGGRDGNSSFNIRGLEGNRVLFVVDGVRVPEGFSFGPAAFGRGDFADLDLLRSVEIIRGPASALYGSDGVAGAVSFITQDPIDLLADGDTFGGGARVTYSSADESLSESVTGAWRSGGFEALLAYTRRDGSELDNQGDNDALNGTRTAPNPQETESNAVLAKLIFSPNEDHRFRLTYDWGDRNVVTEAYSARTATVLDLDGRDESEHQRIALDYRFENLGLFDSGQVTIYQQESNSLQFSDEDRTSTDRTRTTTFDNDVWGGALQLQDAFNLGGAEHRLTYGGDFSHLEAESLRQGLGPTVGDPLPNKPVPDTEFDLAGVFIQDEISLMNGQLVLSPALRYDSYDLSATDDNLYMPPDPPNNDPVAQQSDSHISPKFGVVVWPIETFGAFFNYASGFKAPSPSEVNNFFDNPVFGYTSLPNPDLRPETSNSYELGLRWRDMNLAGARVRASIAAFTADYEDFISQEVVGGSGAPGDPIQFQFINLSEVEIWGIESRLEAAWGDGWGVNVASSYTEGTQRVGGAHAPLNSIDPWKVVAGLSWDAPEGRFGGQFIVTHSTGKSRSDVAETCVDAFDSSSACYLADGFTLLDLTGYYRLTDAATLRFGVFNLTDETYSWWSDVRGLDVTNPVLDAYTQPGVNASASIAYRF
jgi:hemoglobin/transferrin/lactoferrin receptor protein